MHRFDPISFVFGLAFVAVATVALFDLPSDYRRWVIPVALVGLGVGIAVAALAPRHQGET
jgi:multisubunit Na+/H+ antiporter MnhG subunit